MQCESRSCFAPEQLRECTTVHDRSSAAARHEIDHNAPPPEIFLHNKWDNNFYLPLPTRVGNRALIFYATKNCSGFCSGQFSFLGNRHLVGFCCFVLGCLEFLFFYFFIFPCFALQNSECELRSWRGKTFVETKVLPPCPLSKELCVTVRRSYAPSLSPTSAGAASAAHRTFLP